MLLRTSAVIVSVATWLGCSPDPYECQSNSQCIDESGNAGICEVDGYCSFTDPGCGSSTQRYDSSAGDGESSACVPASPLACVSQIAVGIAFSCYVRTDGTVWCWGNNTDGELGDGSTTDRAVPVQVVGLPDASSIPAVTVTAAEMHACALLSDGEVWCWGINDELNLGQCDGDSLDNSLRPVRIPKWQNGSGGPSCDPDAYFQAAVPGETIANSISSGGEHTCAIGADRQLYCWGENTTGDQGGEAGQDFTAMGMVPGPLVVSGTNPAFTGHVVDIQSGDDFTCLEKDDNSAWCWGGNDLGELATGGLDPSFTPVAVSGFGDVAQLLVDDETGCVLTKAGAVFCWGNGTSGIFGPAGNLTMNSEQPVNLTTASAMFGGPTAETVCLNTATDALECWGDNGTGEAGIGALLPISLTVPTQALLSSVAQLRVGQVHTCALTRDGTVWCWGDNVHGELGNGVPAQTATPVPQRVQVVCP